MGKECKEPTARQNQPIHCEGRLGERAVKTIIILFFAETGKGAVQREEAHTTQKYGTRENHASLW